MNLLWCTGCVIALLGAPDLLRYQPDRWTDFQGCADYQGAGRMDSGGSSAGQREHVHDEVPSRNGGGTPHPEAGTAAIATTHRTPVLMHAVRGRSLSVWSQRPYPVLSAIAH